MFAHFVELVLYLPEGHKYVQQTLPKLVPVEAHGGAVEALVDAVLQPRELQAKTPTVNGVSAALSASRKLLFDQVCLARLNLEDSDFQKISHPKCDFIVSGSSLLDNLQ